MKKIFEAFEQPYADSFMLQDLISWNAFAFKEQIEEVSGVASGEYALELQLANAIAAKAAHDSRISELDAALEAAESDESDESEVPQGVPIAASSMNVVQGLLV